MTIIPIDALVKVYQSMINVTHSKKTERLPRAYTSFISSAPKVHIYIYTADLNILRFDFDFNEIGSLDYNKKTTVNSINSPHLALLQLAIGP